MLVAAAAAGLAVWLHGRATGSGRVDDVAPQPQAPADSDATAAEPLRSADAGRSRAEKSGLQDEPAATSTPAAKAADPDAPLAIIADPAELRVWHNTRVTLRAQAADPARFTRYIWHFEDGSDPAEGETVVHVFPESVADRHVTVQALGVAPDKLTVSRTLPIERLAVVPLDGEPPPIKPIPRPKGTRLLFVAGALPPDTLADIVQRAGPITAIIAASADASTSLGRTVADEPPILRLERAPPPSETDSDPTNSADPLASPAFGTDAGDDRVHKLIAGTAEVVVIGDLGIVVHDSRADVADEATIQRTLRAMAIAAGYRRSIVLTARPLSPLVDGGTAAVSAFRVYEGAVRHGVRAVISAQSEVAYDARYGAVEAIAVGSAVNTGGCRRLKGHDACQSPTVTLVDVPASGRVRSLHLRGPTFVGWLSGAELPAAVGKYRR